MPDQELFLSVMTLGIIRKGVDRLASRDVAQTLVLERWLGQVKGSFLDRLTEVDALIAPSALKHDLTLVTRNEIDFAGTGIRVRNPFRSDAPPSAVS